MTAEGYPAEISLTTPPNENCYSEKRRDEESAFPGIGRTADLALLLKPTKSPLFPIRQECCQAPFPPPILPNCLIANRKVMNQIRALRGKRGPRGLDKVLANRQIFDPKAIVYHGRPCISLSQPSAEFCSALRSRSGSFTSARPFSARGRLRCIG